MNTIRSYLESMFAKLPNTPDVIKAKCELGQMMEDKYTELISEGKSENEAVGQVISEFGNLDELGEVLGISSILNRESEKYAAGRQVTFQEAQSYLDDKAHYALFHGLGTFFAIICSCGVILASTLEKASQKTIVAGLIFLFVSIAACVAFHTYSNLQMNKWDFLKKEPCSIDYGTAGMINDLRRTTHDTSILQRTIAILLFCTCYIPLIVLTMLNDQGISAGLGVDILLFMVGLGVLILTVSSSREDGCRTLLNLNSSPYSANYYSQNAGEVRYENKTVRVIMSVFWPTVTCAYLIWSFLTFAWYITWIIWPLAAVANTLIKAIFGIRKEDDRS